MSTAGIAPLEAPFFLATYCLQGGRAMRLCGHFLPIPMIYGRALALIVFDPIMSNPEKNGCRRVLIRLG